MVRILLGLFSLCLVSCETNNELPSSQIPLTGINVTGNWELIETKISPGGEVDWSPAEDSDMYIFAADGIYQYRSSTVPEADQNGTYTIEDGILRLRYDNNDGAMVESGYFLNLDGDEMILGYIGCIEECSYKYKRKN